MESVLGKISGTLFGITLVPMFYKYYKRQFYDIRSIDEDKEHKIAPEDLDYLTKLYGQSYFFNGFEPDANLKIYVTKQKDIIALGYTKFHWASYLGIPYDYLPSQRQPYSTEKYNNLIPKIILDANLDKNDANLRVFEVERPPNGTAFTDVSQLQTALAGEISKDIIASSTHLINQIDNNNNNACNSNSKENNLKIGGMNDINNDNIDIQSPKTPIFSHPFDFEIACGALKLCYNEPMIEIFVFLGYVWASLTAANSLASFIYTTGVRQIAKAYEAVPSPQLLASNALLYNKKAIYELRHRNNVLYLGYPLSLILTFGLLWLPYHAMQKTYFQCIHYFWPDNRVANLSLKASLAGVACLKWRIEREIQDQISQTSASSHLNASLQPKYNWKQLKDWCMWGFANPLANHCDLDQLKIRLQLLEKRVATKNGGKQYLMSLYSLDPKYFMRNKEHFSSNGILL